MTCIKSPSFQNTRLLVSSAHDEEPDGMPRSSVITWLVISISGPHRPSLSPVMSVSRQVQAIHIHKARLLPSQYVYSIHSSVMSSQVQGLLVLPTFKFSDVSAVGSCNLIISPRENHSAIRSTTLAMGRLIFKFTLISRTLIIFLLGPDSAFFRRFVPHQLCVLSSISAIFQGSPTSHYCFASFARFWR